MPVKTKKTSTRGKTKTRVSASSPKRTNKKSGKPRFSVFGRDHSKAKKKSTIIEVSKQETLDGLFGSLPFYIRDRVERLEEHYGR